jgi:hypothetical protein
MNDRRRHPSSRILGHVLVSLFLYQGLGCHTLHLTSIPNEKPEKEPQVSRPSKHTFRISQYVFYSDFEVNRSLPLFAELASLRDQVYKDLQLPSANTVVNVYLFETRQRYERFMKSWYPDLPRRRAFFVLQPRRMGGVEDLLVYTYWGERIQEDLRHELTHALLHSVMTDVPLWLDEGLAEYFEVPPGWKGINYQHLDRLRGTGAASIKPNLARLEQLSQVEQMKPAEYREAWAWVHFMLQSSPEAKRVLVGYLQELRKNKNAPVLRPRLSAAVPDLEKSLEAHLARLDGIERPLAATRSSK